MKNDLKKINLLELDDETRNTVLNLINKIQGMDSVEIVFSTYNTKKIFIFDNEEQYCLEREQYNLRLKDILVFIYGYYDYKNKRLIVCNEMLMGKMENEYNNDFSKYTSS